MSFKVDSMHTEWEGFAAINFFEFSGSTIKSVELMDLLGEHLCRGFFAVNLGYFLLVAL